jgi:hypothetical protein
MKITSFDTYLDDNDLFNFIRFNVTLGDLLLITSYDEISNNLKDVTKKYLNDYYGLYLINNIKYRDTYVAITQYGINKSYSIEYLNNKRFNNNNNNNNNDINENINNNYIDYALQSQIYGCIKLPRNFYYLFLLFIN